MKWSSLGVFGLTMYSWQVTGVHVEHRASRSYTRIMSNIVKRREHVVKPLLAIARAALCIGAVHLFVCLSVAKMQKNAIFSKTKQFRAMVSVDDL